MYAVLGGFVEATKDGHTTTLGRGGSDYSGALVGAGIGADEIQIWTDVDGMMTCDPRLIPGARVIERISYVEAAELAWFGAKVLHPRTIAPAVAERIPVRVLNTHNIASPGTLITEEGDPRQSGPRAVAVKRGITVVHMTSTAGLVGTLGMANYAAAKLGIAGLSRSIAIDLGHFGIRSNAISPAALSRMVEATPNQTPEMAARIERRGRVQKPEHVANLAVFLLSDAAKGINGQIFGARGGDVVLAQDVDHRRAHQARQQTHAVRR